MGEIVAIIVTTLTAVLQPTDSGWTSGYAKGVMQYQIEYHGLDMTGLHGAVAAEDCARIGEIWLIRPEGTLAWRSVVVADCAGLNAYDEHGVSWMERQNIICELSWELGQLFGVGGKVEVVRP